MASYLSGQPLLYLSPFLLFGLVIPFCGKDEERDDFPHEAQLGRLPPTLSRSLPPLSQLRSRAHLAWCSAKSITHHGQKLKPVASLRADAQLKRASANTKQPIPSLY